MPRRRYERRPPPPPDARYNSLVVAQLTNKIMQRGKKSVAEKIIWQAFEKIAEQSQQDPLEVLDRAMKNATPLLKVKPRRVGGATYQVPVEVRGTQGAALGMRWLLEAARARKGRPMMERLAAELLDASRGQGAAVKRREDTHKMAEANRAFAHYRW